MRDGGGTGHDRGGEDGNRTQMGNGGRTAGAGAERHRRGTGTREGYGGRTGTGRVCPSQVTEWGQAGYGGTGPGSGSCQAASAHLEGAVVMRGQVAQVVLGRAVPPRLLLHQRRGLSHTGRQAGGQPARRPGPSPPPPRPRTHRLPHARRLVALVEVGQRIHHDIPGHQPRARHLGRGRAHCACANTSRPAGPHAARAQTPPPRTSPAPLGSNPAPSRSTAPGLTPASAPPLPV